MADGKGIRRLIQLVLDKASTTKVKRELKDTLDKGTDPKVAQKNLGVIRGALQTIGKAALALGGVLAGVFAARAIIRFGKEAVRVAAEAGEIWNRLGKAVDSVGVSFKAVEGDIRATARAMQSATTVGDEDFAMVLTELITTSGKYQESLRNVSLVADLAAAKQIDLRSAAMLVGRAMVGQTQTLTRYGIVVEEGADAVEVMRDRFAGFAANEANTFAGKLKQINNEWQDFKEAIGEAITEADNGVSVMETLRGAIEGLTVWVENNRIQLNRLATAALGAAENMAKFLGVVLDFLDPIGAMARGQMEVINNLESEEALLAKRVELSQQILDLTKEQNAEEQVARLLSGVRQKQAQERVAEIDSEISAIQALIRQIDRLMDARSRAGQPPPPSGGTSIGQPGAAFPSMRGVPIEFGTPTMIDPRDIHLQTIDVYGQMQEAARQHADLMVGIMQGAAFRISDAFAMGFEAIIMDMSSLPKAAAGIGLGIVAGLVGGLAQYHEAQAVGKLAEGTWPPNPAAIKAALGHLAAAGLFRAVEGLAAKGQRNLSRGSAESLSGGAASSLGVNRAGEREGPEIHIYIDPLNPDDPAYQDHVQRTVSLATERWGDQRPVHVHRRTG